MVGLRTNKNDITANVQSIAESGTTATKTN